MLQLSNDAVALRCESDGSQTVLEDRHRKIAWRLDDATRRIGAVAGGPTLLRHGTSTIVSPTRLRQDFVLAGARVSLTWELLDDGVAITLDVDETQTEAGTITAVAMPGSFTPEGAPLRLALPIMQGVLFDGRGEPFEQSLVYGGHEALSMAMLGYLTARAGLLLAIEDYADWRGVVGKREDGQHFAYAEQATSLGAMRYPRRVHLYLTDPGLTPLCKRYRRRVQARDEWKGWDEKMAERPGAERLFGALMAFAGYNRAGIDYVAECRKLRALGFERAFLYPLRFNTYTQDFLMGGDRPIDVSDADLGAIKALGYDVAPWSWVFEALDDGSERIHCGYRRDASGQPIPGWKLDEFQWYQCCTPSQAEFTRQAYAGPMRAMTWSHFDVTASLGPLECYALDHPAHAGRPLDRRAELGHLRELLGTATNGERVVSSEGFRDCLSTAYDIGSTKLLPAFGSSPFWAVPMTMLVYHDSVIHDWWEVHNYNAHGGFDNSSRWGHKMAGHPHAKAAMDALYGCPPNVFPFGRQYRWLDLATRKTESYTVRLEDAAVQEALRAALPVTRLHRRIGPLELLDHEFLSEDGAMQATTFADGTRVVAHFAAGGLQGPGINEANTWRVESR